MQQTSTRYISLPAAIVSVLRDLGGRADINTVLVEVWRRYVGDGGPVKVTMRLYRRPSGYYWSPDAEEALEVLEAAGVVYRKGRLVILRSS